MTDVELKPLSMQAYLNTDLGQLNKWLNVFLNPLHTGFVNDFSEYNKSLETRPELKRTIEELVGPDLEEKNSKVQKDVRTKEEKS